MLNKAGIPGCPINTVDRMVKDPHIAEARNMFPEIDHPVAGKTKLTNNAIKFTATSSEPEKPAPTLGQDNDIVYGEFLGLNKEEIAQLKASAII
jgi:formyl-CoA transferase